MKGKSYVALFVLFTACNIHAEGGYEYEGLEERGPIGTITVTPTNLVIKFMGGAWTVNPDIDYDGFPYLDRRTQEYIDNHEVLVLPPDTRTAMTVGHGIFTFTPAVLKNGLKGFQITEHSLTDYGWTRKNYYVALSDTPVEAGEDDVEMIMGGGKVWQKFEKPHPPVETKPVEALPPEPVPPPVAESPPIKVATASPPLESRTGVPPVSVQASPPSRLWLYVGGLLLIFCATFIVLWKKQNRP